MAYSETQERNMRILHGMLESDSLRTVEEFTKVFICLRDQCLIPWENVQKILDKPPWLLEAWTRGENVPKQNQWPEIRHMVMRVIEEELRH